MVVIEDFNDVLLLEYETMQQFISSSDPVVRKIASNFTTRLMKILIKLSVLCSVASAPSISNKEDRFEDFGVEMQIKLRKGFLSLAHEFPNRFMVIDGNRTEVEVAENISKRLREIG